ncbi:MAG: nuclear transport factor 2 family protein [Caldimonas sp.]
MVSIPGSQPRWRVLLCTVALALGATAAQSQTMRIPADAVDGFHAALKRKDTAAALSFLDRSLVVFEFGAVDPTVESYALQHLPFDIDMAVASSWALQSRRVGGEGAERWVLSTYRVTGARSDGKPIDQTTLETAIVRRVGEQFRIVHLHWSTSDAAHQAWMQTQRPKPP